MRRNTGKIVALVLFASLAALRALPAPGPDEDVAGGHLSRLCRAGIWLMAHGRSMSGAGLMWLGC